MSLGPSNPKISVVVASYNRAELLCEAVRSVLDQAGPEVEVVVSDDCSRDDSVARLRAIADPRVRVHAQAANVGVWLNWATALGMARGEYVVFLGDDDKLSEHFLESHLRCFEQCPDVSVVFSALEDLPVDGSPSRCFRPRIPVGKSSPGTHVIEGVLEGNCFFGAAMFRREIAQSVWQETRCDDLVADWGLILGVATTPGARVSACDGCLYIKRVPAVRLSTRLVEISERISGVCRRFEDRCKDPRARQALKNRAVLERVTLSRHFAAEGNIAKCREVLTSLLGMAARRPMILSQWLQAFLMPERVMRTAREQRGLVSQTPAG
jgi:hypothetical protein